MRERVDARHLLYYLCSKRPMRITYIQKYMKANGYNINHSSIIHGINVMKKLMVVIMWIYQLCTKDRLKEVYKQARRQRQYNLNSLVSARINRAIKMVKCYETDEVIILNTTLGGDYYKEITKEQYNILERLVVWNICCIFV